MQAGHEQRCKPSVAWIKHWEEGVRSSNSKINPDKTKKERTKQRWLCTFCFLPYLFAYGKLNPLAAAAAQLKLTYWKLRLSRSANSASKLMKTSWNSSNWTIRKQPISHAAWVAFPTRIIVCKEAKYNSSSPRGVSDIYQKGVHFKSVRIQFSKSNCAYLIRYLVSNCVCFAEDVHFNFLHVGRHVAKGKLGLLLRYLVSIIVNTLH